MYQVKLNGLKYHAYHGLFPQEKKTGNNFIVSACVKSSIKLEKKNTLESLINYVWLKDTVDTYMNQRFDLLEDILAHIVADIQEEYPESTGQISIKKEQPPFGGRCDSSEVTLEF